MGDWRLPLQKSAAIAGQVWSSVNEMEEKRKKNQNGVQLTVAMQENLNLQRVSSVENDNLTDLLYKLKPFVHWQDKSCLDDAKMQE